MDERARRMVTGEWVLLSYRLPREPSTPRIALWRRLKRLGVAQLGDGLVALPCDARTREQLEWVADEAVEAGGSASVWLARPGSRAQERSLVESMTAARGEEYAALAQEAAVAVGLEVAERARVLRRLRRTWREVTRRDFFPPPQREGTAEALRVLADEHGGAPGSGSGSSGASGSGSVAAASAADLVVRP